MCGICGVYETSGNPCDQAVIERMNDSMLHRGPDSGGSLIQHEAGLGIRRLAIIDLRSGDQPLYNEERTCAVILNGAIYNFRQVREELSKKGHRFSSDGDTEVIVHAYEEWGTRCVERLRGMFSFVICDWRSEREGRKLFIARDRLGVKPLYFFHDDKRFVFASEVRALLASGLVPRKLSTEGLQTYLAFGSVQEPLTLIEGIRSLPPGHWVTADRNGIRSEAYWKMPNDTASDSKVPSSEELRAKLLEATELRLVSDVPLGVFLSGGIDSGAITGLMSEISPDPVRAITVGFQEGDYDESRLAKATATHTKVAHQLLEVTQADVLRDMPLAIAGMDQPTIDGINTWYVSRETKRNGVTVALSGVGGDELFAGYDIFPRLLRLERYQRLMQAVPSGLRSAASRAFRNGNADRNEKFIALLKGQVPFGHPYFLARSWFSNQQQQALMMQNWRDEVRIPRWSDRVGQDLASSKDMDAIGQISFLDMRNYMLSRLLRDTDFMSMAHSLEVRTPFLDHELVETVIPIPGDKKFDGHSSKPMLVNAVSDLLPPEVAAAKKSGFNFPWEVWLRGELKEPVKAALTAESKLTSMLSPQATGQVWTDFEAGRTSWSRPWGLYVLGKWLDGHVD